MATSNSTQQITFNGQHLEGATDLVDAINMRIGQVKAIVDIWGKAGESSLNDASPEFAASAICDFLSEIDKLAEEMCDRLVTAETRLGEVAA